MAEAQPPSRRIRAGDDDREAILKVLEDSFAAGRLDDAELRERQDRALRVRYLDEASELVDDLPEGRALGLDDEAPVEPMPAVRHSGELAAPDLGGSLTFMSGKQRILPFGTERMSNFAWWGGDDIDVSEAMGPGRTITLTLSAIMGGHNVYVPEGVRVIDESIAIMAGNDIDKQAQGDGSNGTLIIKGFLFWAGSEIKLAGNKKGKKS